MKMKLTIIILMSVFLLMGCRKDQRKVNRIDGKWDVVTAEISNFGEVEPEIVFNFDWCKVRKEDFCDFSAFDFSKEESMKGLYSVSRDGKSLTLDWQDNQYYNFDVFEIERLNFRTLILVNKNPESDSFTKIKLRSVD